MYIYLMEINNRDIFKDKYIKYKNKYINLKNQQGGVLCPADYKLCDVNTKNMNLCIKKTDDCEDIKIRGLVNISKPPNEDALRKGYVIDNLHRNCYLKDGYDDIKFEYNFTNDTPIQGEFKIATYNIWGLDLNDNSKELIGIRMPLIAKTINDNSIDIICFQEMSYTTFDVLNNLLKDKYNIYEVRLPTQDLYKERKHDVECAVAIKHKFKPKRIVVEPLGGNLTYMNSLMIIYFENLTIFNCYLQAGTKYSVGQEDLYLHYSRCRFQLLEYIIGKIPKDSNCIILGDFNINLNDSGENFPEIRMIHYIEEKLGFVDNWKAKHKTEGFTENTDINLMRWNDKFIDKKARVDGILSRGLQIIDCKIIGDEDFTFVDKNYEWYIKNFTPNKKLDLLGKIMVDGKPKIPIFGSDHFGVLSTLQI